MRRTCCAIATSNTPVTMAAALRCASPPPVIAIALSVRIVRWVRKRRRRPCAAGCPVPVTARTSWMRASRKWAWPIPPAAAANPASIGCRNSPQRAESGVAIARIGMNHAVEIGDTQIRISDHRKLYLGALRLLDVVLPCNVVIDRVDRHPDHLDAALFKFALELRGGAKLSGADRGIVLGMREQHAPGVSEPRVQVDFPNGGIRFEIRCDVSELQCHEWALRRSS